MQRFGNYFDVQRLQFAVTSRERTPDEISALVNMSPDRSWTLGDRRPATILLEKENGWAVESGLPPDVELADHFSALLRRVRVNAEKFRSLPSDCKVVLECVLYCRTANPGVSLAPDVVSELNDLGAELDFDIYFLPEVDTEP